MPFFKRYRRSSRSRRRRESPPPVSVQDESTYWYRTTRYDREGDPEISEDAPAPEPVETHPVFEQSADSRSDVGRSGFRRRRPRTRARRRAVYETYRLNPSRRDRYWSDRLDDDSADLLWDSDKLGRGRRTIEGEILNRELENEELQFTTEEYP